MSESDYWGKDIRDAQSRLPNRRIPMTDREKYWEKEAKELAQPILIKYLFTADDLPKCVAHLMEDLYPVIAAALDRVDRQAVEREKGACADHLEAMASALVRGPKGDLPRHHSLKSILLEKNCAVVVSYHLRSAAASLPAAQRGL